MGVTHVIRGDDHLTNAARQSQIYRAMGWTVPAFAHIPLIHGADGAKLSKRHGALGVDAYRAMGYLPEALKNYLARLGWSHGDDEIFSMEDAVGWFQVSDINKGAARFDFAKLENLNGVYMRQTSDEDLWTAFRAFLPHTEDGRALLDKLDDALEAKIRMALPGLKERAKTLVELLDGCRFIHAARPLPMEEKAAALLDEAGLAVIAALVPRLEAVADWSAEATEAVVRAHAEEAGLKLGKAAQPLRAALTGRTTSPGIFDVLAVLGRDETIARLRDRLAA